MSFKVTIIGGGSSSFVPILLRRLIQSGPLGDSTVTLMDIDERRLGVMQELGDRLVAGEESPLTVRSTPEEGLKQVSRQFEAQAERSPGERILLWMSASSRARV